MRSFDDRNMLLNNGISTLDLLPDSTVRINLLTSAYLTNSQGKRDGAYLELQTAETLARIREVTQEAITKEFSGYKLSLNSNDRFEAGSKIVNLNTFRAWLINFYQNTLIAKYGWYQDGQNYVETLEVIASGKSRINYKDQPTLVRGLYVTEGVAQFK